MSDFDRVRKQVEAAHGDACDLLQSLSSQDKLTSEIVRNLTNEMRAMATWLAENPVPKDKRVSIDRILRTLGKLGEIIMRIAMMIN